MRRITLLAAGLLLVAAASSWAGEARINVNDVARQRVPVALMDDAGAARVVWQNTKLGIMTRVVPVADPARATAPEKLLLENTHVPAVPGEGIVLTHSQPAVLHDADGGFRLFWTRQRAFLEVVPFYERRVVLQQEIRSRRFDRNGEPRGEETVVAPSAAFQSQPAAIALADGSFVVAWWSDDGNRDLKGSDGVFARWFEADGTPRGGAVRLSPVEAGELASQPSLAAGGNNRVMVLWQAPDGSSTGVYRRFFDGVAPLGQPARLNGNAVGAQSQPVAVARPEGGFFALWQGAVGVRLKTQIFLRELDASGRPVGAERTISGGPLEYEMGPAIAPTGRETYFVAWVLWDASFPRAMRGIELARDGSVVGEERNLSSFRVNAVYKAVLAGDPASGLFAVWEGFPQKRPGISGRRLEFLD